MKSLGVSADGIHRRQELEAEIQSLIQHHWPDALEKTIEPIIGNQTLKTVALLHQRRSILAVHHANCPVAEVALDQIRQRIPFRRRYQVLEIELSSNGSERDLGAIRRHLLSRFFLKPDPLSKLERALSMRNELQ
jgi:inorganic triphosphatase YgiF